VPNDFKVAGKRETLSVEVHYDTLDLYGKLSASRRIVLSPK